MTTHRILTCATVLAATLACGCTSHPPRDRTAFLAAKPVTLLVLPPVNKSVDVTATAAVWAQATRPLAEAGYYVLPITVVDEMFKQNGVDSAHSAAEVPIAKLREVFGADAAVYLEIRDYGTKYMLIESTTKVSLATRIVDLRSGALLWDGTAMARSSSSSGGGGIAGMLAGAIITQVINDSTDAAYGKAGEADQELLGLDGDRGIPPGPRSPKYGVQQAGTPR